MNQSKPDTSSGTRRVFTMTHWGVYEVEARAGRIQRILPWRDDPDPSPIGQSMKAVGGNRVERPMVRESWLAQGPGSGQRRGAEAFVPVSWERALDLVAGELGRVRGEHGNSAIFAGSYGWASAGRFHHALSQLHRFMNAIGGYTRSVNTYSLAAAEVIVPHVVGHSYDWVQREATSLGVVARHTQLLVTFGGIPLKNAQIQSGGQGRHVVRGHLREARANGCRMVSFSPLRDDMADELDAEWVALRPNSDTAVLLALAHTLIEESLADRAFIDRYTVGFEPLRAYLTGEADGLRRDADWAAALSGVSAACIRDLAREMAHTRCMINVSWSLQRADHGEQPYWAAIALAALLGQIGLPGGGFTLGYGAVGSVGNGARRVKLPALPRLPNGVDEFIPVARIADMLLHPGEPFDYDGQRLTYPDIRLVYWAGGNPFHHHQDLNRLVKAWRRPETVVVHEPFWTATARHADIVLPATTPLERNDIGGTSQDSVVVAMRQAITPIGEARNDYDIFSALAQRLEAGEAFTEGRDEMAWLRQLYAGLEARQPGIPDFDTFWEQGIIDFRDRRAGESDRVLLDAFRGDPDGNALPTPSGRLELFSETIAGFNYADCPPHPAWLEPCEWLGSGLARRYPLHLISNQPSTRLHSQWDHGEVSQAAKIASHEALLIHPRDAEARGIDDGAVVRVFNGRGQTLAGARVTERVMPGVVVLPTGAPFQPRDPASEGSLETGGNPNVLTRDAGASRLSQGPSAQTCLVQVETYAGP